MEVLFKLVDIAFFVAIFFVTVAALVAAVQCNKRPGNAIGAWILFLGCLVGLFVSLGHLIISFLPAHIIFTSVETPYAVYASLSFVNLVSTLAMVVGVALFRPLAAKGRAQ